MAQNDFTLLHMKNQGQDQDQDQDQGQGQEQVQGEEEQAREEEGEQDQEHEQEQEEVQEQEQEGYRNREHTTCSEKTTNNAVSMTDSMHSKLSSPFSSSSSPSSSSPPPPISPLSADALMKHAKSKERKGKEGKKSPSSSKSEGKAKGKAKVTATTTTTATSTTVNKKKQRNNDRNINSNLVKSNFRGVSWHSQLNKWRCYVYPRPGQQKYVGVFLREEDAAKARDDMVKELNIVRDMGRLNFPNNASPSPQSSSSSCSSSAAAAASPASTGTSSPSTGTYPSSTGTSSPSSGGSSPSSGASSAAQRTHRCRRKTQKSQRNTQQDQHRHVIPSPRAPGNGRSFLPPPSTPPTAVPAAATTGASTAMTPNHNTSRSLNQCSDGHQMGNASSYSRGNNLPSLAFSSNDNLSDENGKPVEGGTTSNVSAGGKQPVPNHPLQNQHQHSRGHVHVLAPPYAPHYHHDDIKDEPYNRQEVQEDFNDATVLHSQECPIDSPGIINVNQQMSKPKKDSKQVPSQLPTSGSMPLQNQYQNQYRNQYQNQYHCNPQVIHHQNSNSNQQYNTAQRHTMLPYHVAQWAFPSESDLRFSWAQQPHFQSQSQLLPFNSQFPPSPSSSYFDNSQFLSQRQPQHQIQHQAENQPQKPCFPPLQHSVPQSALSFQRCLDKLYSGQHRRQQQQYSQHALPMSFAPLHHHDTSASTGRNDSNR